MFGLFKNKLKSARLQPGIPNGDKALIIGSKGNLGGQLMRVFGNTYRLVLWDREDINITDPEQVKVRINEIKPHYIINAAAYNAVDKCEESGQEYQKAKEINGTAVGYLADAAIRIGATLVHYSTNYVFSGNNQYGYKEDDEPAPISNYGRSKLMGEKEILQRASHGLKYYLIRSSKLFGPKGESGLTKPSFFDIMLKLAKEKPALEAVDGEVSCFTYTLDLARETKWLIENNRPSGIYHIVNPGAVTWYQAAVELFKLIRPDIKVLPVPAEKFPRPARRPAFAELKNTKLKPLRSYREALEEYLKSL